MNYSKLNDATEWLEQVLHEKIRTNPSFSLRAFAKRVDVSPSYLSRILSRQRQLNTKTALKICEAMGYGPLQKEQIFGLLKKNKKIEKKEQVEEQGNHMSLTLDAFAVVSDWYHYAINELFFTENFIDDPRWIAKKLGIGILEVKLALKRLERLGIIERVDGKLVRSNTSLSTTNDIVSSGLRRFHKQILEKALLAINEVPLDKRDITSITVATNPNNIPKVKKEIKKFRKKIAGILETGEKTEVYNLNINLIPLNKETAEEI